MDSPAPPLEHRHRSATLVCRDWHSAANSGELNRELHVCAGSPGVVPRLRWLQQWVLRHCSRHVTRVLLALALAAALASAEHHEACAIVAGTLAACTGLQEAHIISPVSPMGWRARQQVRTGHARLGRRFRCEQSPAVALGACHLLLTTFSDLPLGRPLLVQDGVLAALTRLSLYRFRFAQNNTLGRLPSLQRLQLSSCATLPSDLSALTSLEALAVENSHCHGLNLNQSDAARLEAVLPSLTRLTGLWIDASASDPAFEHPPATLTALTRLRLLSLESINGGGAEGAALPDGPWLAGLERLVQANVCCTTACRR